MKILIIQTAFLGDLILTTSFFREVKEKYKGAEIHLIVNKGTLSRFYKVSTTGKI